MEFDSKSLSLAAAAFAAVVALPLLASAGPAPTPQFAAEKCFGIAAAAHEDLRRQPQEGLTKRDRVGPRS